MGRGPFALSTPEDAILSIQMFLMIPSVPFLLLSVLRVQQSRTDSALRESERRFRSLVDTAPVMVWMSDSDAFCTYVNKPWLDFTGVPFERHLGMGYADSLHPEDRDRFLREYLSVFQLRGTFTLEHRMRHNDGTYRWVLNHGTPRRGSEGKFLGFIGSCIDIEDRKKTEQELLRLHRALIDAQETERQRIGQELHDDLGQRAVALSIGISLLSQESNGNGKLRAGFLDIQRQVSDIVKDIAQLSHRLRPSILERLGLPDALRDLCGKSRVPAGVEIVFTQEGDFPETIPSSAAIALYRVAQEALRNALAHSESTYIEIRLTSKESALLMTVEDRGRGFTADGGSTGLGLSGMAERMKNVGGTLDVRSAPGEGTTVCASLPWTAGQEVLPARDAERA
jgi:PAS domain S-box-containing protein